MIDVSDIEQHTFADWGKSAEIIDTGEIITVIHKKENQFSNLGVASFDNDVGYLLIRPQDKAKISEKTIIKLIDADITVVVDREPTIQEDNIIRLSISRYDSEEAFDGFNFG